LSEQNNAFAPFERLYIFHNLQQISSAKESLTKVVQYISLKVHNIITKFVLHISHIP